VYQNISIFFCPDQVEVTKKKFFPISFFKFPIQTYFVENFIAILAVSLKFLAIDRELREKNSKNPKKAKNRQKTKFVQPTSVSYPGAKMFIGVLN
jgi:hypothetical protein